ncbi:MAG: Smr/MutS family protein [Armatimonadetes bacterium]|nr:Smr/MutS family protein [Armatimonadota bacterium]
MKLKLDLHPIYNDSRQIEASLQGIIEEALEKRATEVEIIPGKGSGALKKAVLRFLDRPEIRARYHRIEKDGDNWGRLFIHFRFEREQAAKAVPAPRETVTFDCFCCAASVKTPLDREALPETRVVECPACGSPNRVTLRTDRQGQVRVSAESGYEG